MYRIPLGCHHLETGFLTAGRQPQRAVRIRAGGGGDQPVGALRGERLLGLGLRHELVRVLPGPLRLLAGRRQ